MKIIKIVFTFLASLFILLIIVIACKEETGDGFLKFIAIVFGGASLWVMVGFLIENVLNYYE